MFDPIWQAIADELSGDRAKAFAERLWAHARWNSFDRMRQTAHEAAAILREIGLADVQVIEYPADGTTAHGGWVMPHAWDVEDATLEIVEPQVGEPLLARYRHCPQALMMYSAPTPHEEAGLVAEVVAADDGRDLAGRIALVDGVGINVGMNAFERGAVGIVSDAMKLLGTPQEKAPGHFDRAVQWHNYTIPPWKTEPKGFGFSISPAGGRRLRELLRSHPTVKLRAVVRTRLYDGVLPLVTGLLPGETDEEIAITGHLFEPGANDNASGCALGMEIARAIQALDRQGKLARRRRGIRLVLSFEVRGYQAFLATWPHLRRLVAGINLDMVGNDLADARAQANLLLNWPTLPAYTGTLALALLHRLQRESPSFRFRTHAAGLVDNLFGEPAVGAPMCVLGAWPDATYHTSLDRIDTLSPRAFEQFGLAAGTYAAFLACACFDEALRLAQATAEHAQRELQEAEAKDIGHIAARNLARLRSVCRLVRAPSVTPTREGFRRARDALCPASGLFWSEELRERVEELCAHVRPSCGPSSRAEPPLAPDEERARRLAPLRLFKGSLCFESLDEVALHELKEQTGLGVSWGAPNWLQLALFQNNGKRTAWDIWRWLQHEGGAPELGRFCDTIEFLARHGFIRLRPVLTKADYLAALSDMGLPTGSTVMVHSSLSEFGYVHGGADTVIEALLEAIGPDGTLAMPALSCSWLGRPPFDPKTTPSRVGAITEAFRRRPGVLRSPHPTHSVAAFGPNAAAIVRDHTPDRPVFGDEGAFGRLYALDAWILMLCKLSSNTCLHMAEHRAGLLFTDLVARVKENGDIRTVMAQNAPWHANFDPHYDVLFERDLIRAAPLGEGTVHLMRARDAVDVALENIRENPLLVTREGCECEFCGNIRAHLARQGG